MDAELFLLDLSFAVMHREIQTIIQSLQVNLICNSSVIFKQAVNRMHLISELNECLSGPL